MPAWPSPLIPVLAALTLNFAAPAQAQSSKLTKAIAAVDAYDGGDRAAIEEAREAINLAASHPKTSKLAKTWVLRGHIYLQNVLDPDLGGTSADPTQEVIKAFQKAGELGLEDPADKVSVISDLRVIQSSVQAEVIDKVERRQWAEAYEFLGRAMAARDMLISMDAADDHRDAVLLRLAVLITTHHGELEEASKHHRAYLKAGEFDAGISVQLADKLVSAESPDSALLFLRKVRKDHPQDATLLAREVEVLVAAERAEEAETVLDEAAKGMPVGVGPQLLLAKLYAKARAPEKSEAAYREVFGRDPEVEEALVPMARFLLAEIPLIEATISGEAPDGEPKPEKLSKDALAALEADLADRFASVAGLLQKANAKQPQNREILEMLHSLYEATDDAENVAKTADALGKLDPPEE